MGKTRLDRGTDIGQFLTDLIEGSLKAALTQRAINEKDKQQAIASPEKQQPAQPAQAAPAEPVAEPSQEPAPEDGKNEPPTIKDVIDKMNSIRSGRSFRDSAVSSNLEQYFNDLDDAEKVALVTFLSGIAKIVTGEIPAENVSDPSDPPTNVQMTKSSSPQKTRHIKPNVIGKGVKKSSMEDTTPPAPIQPTK
jgi:hypothetical protein